MSILRPLLDTNETGERSICFTFNRNQIEKEGPEKSPSRKEKECLL